jgi:hypothetical protein
MDSLREMSVSELKRQREELDRKIKKAELLEGPDLIVTSGTYRFKIARTKLVEFVTKEKGNVTVIRDPNDILPTDADLKTFDDMKCSVCKKSGIRLWRRFGESGRFAALFCSKHIDCPCSCFKDNNPVVQMRNCNTNTLWIAAITFSYSDTYLTDFDMEKDLQKEWLQLPIE